MALLITGPLCWITKDKVSPRAFRIASRAFRIVFATIVGNTLAFYPAGHHLAKDSFFDLIFTVLGVHFFLWPLAAFMACLVCLCELGRWMFLRWLMMLQGQEDNAGTPQAAEASASSGVSADTPGSGASERGMMKKLVSPCMEFFLSTALALSFFGFVKLSEVLELFTEYSIPPERFERSLFRVISVDSSGRIHPWDYYGSFVTNRKPGMSLNVPETGDAFKKIVTETIRGDPNIFHYQARRSADGLLEVRYKNDSNYSRYTLKDGQLVQAFYGEPQDSCFSAAALWLAFCVFVRWRYKRWKLRNGVPSIEA
jgi:hypothetical protein